MVGGVTPARRQTSRIDSPSSPRLASNASAASRIERRVASDSRSRERGVAGRAFIGQIYSSAIYTSSTGLMIIKRIRYQSLAPLYQASCGATFLPWRSSKCSTVRPEPSAMPISRRQLIATAGWSVLAGVSPACRGVARLVPAGGEVEAPAGWDAVRRQFNLSPDYTHLS